MKPYSELSQHDKEMLGRIDKIDNEMGYTFWPEIASLAEKLEDEERKAMWLKTCAHYNRLEEAYWER